MRYWHGSGVVAQAVGNTLGGAKKAKMILSVPSDGTMQDEKLVTYEKYLEQMLAVAEDIKKNTRQGRSVMVSAWGFPPTVAPASFFQRMRK